MKYIVYLTVNTKSFVNGEARVYVGVHKVTNKDKYNVYLGNGVWSNTPSTYMYPKSPFQFAVKTYGTKAFIRTALFEYDTAEEALAKEHELVTEEFVTQDHVYNVVTGGDYTEKAKPLYQFDLKGNLIKKWDSMLDAYEFYGLSPNDFESSKKHKVVFLNSFWASAETININDYHTNIVIRNHIYLYSKSGKLLREFAFLEECAEYTNLTVKELTRAIKNQRLVKDAYYVSNKLLDVFKSKPRNMYKDQIFYVYDVTGKFLGQYKGKEVMKAINLHSWTKICNIFEINHNWYKDFYVSLEEVKTVPSKQYSGGVCIDVYTKEGDFIETITSIKEVKEKYKVPSAKLKRIQQGVRYFEDYIFKYNSK